jgi:TolB protein
MNTDNKVPRKATPIILGACVLLMVLLIIAAPVEYSRAAFPGYPGKIVFTCNRNENLEICIIESDGTGEMRLTNNPAADIDPAWSPDGELIVFTSERDGDMEVFTMKPDGSNVTQLTFNHTADFVPAWSNDGSKIVYAADNGGVYDLMVMNANGTDKVNITNTTTVEEFSPAWSPTDDIIAYVSAPEGEFGS